MRPAVLIFNPKSGNQRWRRLVEPLTERLKRAGYAIEARATQGPGDATRLAREAAGAGLGYVFAAGGDGTLREAAAGLLGTSVKLGFLPGGTANVMARVLGLPGNPLAAAAALAEATSRPLDIGLCGNEPFLMQASAGFDARIMELLSPRYKRFLGIAAVIPAGIRALCTYDYPEIRLIADGRELTGSFAAISNIPYYGGRYRLTPAALPDDGNLDLALFHSSGNRATLGFARDLFFGRHLKRDDTETRTVQRVQIRGDAPIQIDGDVYPGDRPVTVTLAPSQLNFLVPM